MPGCPALLLLVWGSVAVCHPEFWPPATKSSPGSTAISRTLQRNKLTGRNLEQKALDGKYQPESKVSVRSLQPTHYCWFYYFSRCPRAVLSSRGRSLNYLKNKFLHNFTSRMFLKWTCMYVITFFTAFNRVCQQIRCKKCDKICSLIC